MRIGLIGRGRWGQVYLKTLADMGVDLAWVVGRDVRYDADAVIIATPAETHFELAYEAMWRGAHVLIEKPVAMDPRHARALLELAQVRRRTAYIDHTHLFAPSWRSFRDNVAGSSEAYIRFGGPFRAPKWWCKGSHAAAMAISLFGRPQGTIFDGDELIIEHERGVSHIQIQDLPCPVQCEAYLNGVAYYDPGYSRPTPMETMLSEFLAACQHHEPDCSQLELGVQITDILPRVQ
jgi:hypothetical protein